MISSFHINKVFTEFFFNPYDLKNHISIKDKFFEELAEQHEYPDRIVDKDDILYLI